MAPRVVVRDRIYGEEREYHARGTPEDGVEHHHDDEDGEAQEAHEIGLQLILQALFHHRRAREDHLGIGILVAVHHPAHCLHHVTALDIRQVSLLPRASRFHQCIAFEARQCFILPNRRGVDDGLEGDGGQAPIAGDQRVEVEGIGEDPLFEGREVSLISAANRPADLRR